MANSPNNAALDAVAERLRECLGDRFELNKPLAPLTSFKTGGKARFFISCTSPEELSRAVTTAAEVGIDSFLLGGGSNLLISDEGYPGLVIKVAIRGIKVLPGNVIEVGSGEDLMSLVQFAADHSLTGLEFASGIWGTVGGAIYGNAGAYGGQIGSLLQDLDLVDRKGKNHRVDAEYCRFGYRDSYLKKTGEIVVVARFKLKPGKREVIQAEVDRIWKIREVKFPPDGLCAGCFFKNIPDESQPYGKLPAGKLLEEVGAKGLKVGGAIVYEKHANVILNTGNASSKDISDLADILRKKVLDKFGITLEEEIIRLGSFQP
ncbi:MAG TPA: UDP-N-acetylmuramate dehydrogenase [candidate division Zixibacteria bacterium]|nr:UDP-N-acetylmuramate dehydrogenase [candidate division Zixibacteria bacterium]